MYLRRHRKEVAGEEYGYWSLVESIRTAILTGGNGSDTYLFRRTDGQVHTLNESKELK